jgi:hypothetical protein
MMQARGTSGPIGERVSGEDRTERSEQSVLLGRARGYSTAALDKILGLLLLLVYIVSIVGLAALITFAVVRIFPTERTPKKPDGGSDESTSGGSRPAGKLFRSAKRGSA